MELNFNTQRKLMLRDPLLEISVTHGPSETSSDFNDTQFAIQITTLITTKLFRNIIIKVILRNK